MTDKVKYDQRLVTRVTTEMRDEIEEARKEIEAQHPGMVFDFTSTVRLLLHEALTARKKENENAS